MEISEELRQYFAQTERHREELKKQQQMEAEQQDSYVPADQDLHTVSWRSTMAPPLERPGERRGAEMKKLYGNDAAKILAMEAAMQLTFDRNCDLKHPKYWPVIPLKLRDVQWFACSPPPDNLGQHLGVGALFFSSPFNQTQGRFLQELNM
ncbi:hypothetical protein INR49_000950, partial [Caranx melampygus]